MKDTRNGEVLLLRSAVAFTKKRKRNEHGIVRQAGGESCT